MRLYKQAFHYDDPWPIVSLAYFLRYPNPYASHVIACDVISRDVTPTGSLLTTRLILKRGILPKWFPNGVIKRPESWVIEESEVDPFGRVVSSRTKNLDHVKIMQVQEMVEFREAEDGGTRQVTQAQIVSRFGWGMTKQIENHGLAKFKANIQKSREGVSLVLRLLRESRLQPLTLGGSHSFGSGSVNAGEQWPHVFDDSKADGATGSVNSGSSFPSAWARAKSWVFGK